MDGIFGVGPLELIIIVALALVVLGPERLPGVIREIAKFIKQTRAIGQELTAQFSQELHLLDDFNPNKILKDIIDSDEEIDAKELLGIGGKDLKLDDVNIKTGITKKSTTGKSTAGKPTAGKSTAEKPTAGKSNATKTSTSKANAPSTAPHKSKAKVNRTSSAVGETDSEDTKITDAVDSKQESTSLEEDSIAADMADSATADPAEENRIAPPNMSNAQSLVRGKSSSNKPQSKTNGSQAVEELNEAETTNVENIGVENISPANSLSENSSSVNETDGENAIADDATIKDTVAGDITAEEDAKAAEG